MKKSIGMIAAMAAMLSSGVTDVPSIVSHNGGGYRTGHRNGRKGVRRNSLLEQQQEKKRKVKRRVSDANRKINQSKARYNKFTR